MKQCLAVPVIVMALLVSGCEQRPEAGVRAREQLAVGQKIYIQHCSACHGAKLEGQPNWRQRLPNGRLPAPPHDDSGHTWHHPPEVLVAIVKNGLVPPYAPPDYQSDMPAFAATLTDAEIAAVLAYIESHWSADVRKLRREMLEQR